MLFQSSPTLSSGRYIGGYGVVGHGGRVSILARPEGRALLRWHGWGPFFRREFQSSPVPKDGRYTVHARPHRASCGFNPRPSRRTGATSYRSAHPFRLCGFNPRPSRRTGATPREHDQSRHSTAVSILARPEGRALPPSAPTTPAFFLSFQSSPVPKDGRYIVFVIIRQRGASLQSSPVPKDGRYPFTGR